MAKYLTNLNLNQNELQNAKIQNLSSNSSIAAPVQGQIYFDSTDKHLYLWNNTAWVALDTANYNLPIATNAVLGGVKEGANTAVTAIEINGTTGIIAHVDTSSASNVTASGRTYVTGITFDTFGHVQATTTGTETVVNTDTTYDLVAASNTGGAKIMLNGSDSSSDAVVIKGLGATSVAYGNSVIEITTAAGVDTYHDGFAWVDGTSAGPTANITSNNGAPNITVAAIPAANGTVAGIITTGVQSFAGNKTFSDNVIITSNLTVNGQTTTVNSTVVQIEDPVFTLGGTAPLTVDDGKDRGIEFRWYNGAAKTGFFGFDRSTEKFTFIPTAVNTGEVFSGTKGTLDANIEWADILNKATTATSNDFGVTTIAADSGFTWNTANAVTPQTAESAGDTLTLVPGTSINLYGSTVAGTDAIKIEHADTSTITGQQGSVGISDITVDGLGHVTAVNTATYMRRYSTTVTSSDSVDTTHNIVHNLGTQDVIVQIYQNATTWDQVVADVRHTNATTVVILMGKETTATDYRVVVVG